MLRKVAQLVVNQATAKLECTQLHWLLENKVRMLNEDYLAI